MAIREKYKKISVTKSVHDRLKKDRDEFQKKIGGGRWSISDAIEEYFKILDLTKK